MKLLSALITLSFAPFTAAINLIQRDVSVLAILLAWHYRIDLLAQNPRVARLDIQRDEIQDSLIYDQLQKRQKTIQQTAENSLTVYYANVSLGTPAQNLRLVINTGGSDTWVNSVNSTLCSVDNACGTSGAYNSNRSSTYIYVNDFFKRSYGGNIDGGRVSGVYATDNLRIGNQNVQYMQFGIAYNSSKGYGLLGIGYVTNEAQVVEGLAAYPNLPQQLAKDGKINSNTYSLWLNDLNAGTGRILFGGVDTTKYTGSLGSVDIIPSQGVYSQFFVGLTAIGQNGVYNWTSNPSMPVLLESGTTFSYLPSNITTSLHQQFNVSYNSTSGVGFVDCSLASQPGTIDFSFSGVNISVPLKLLVLPWQLANGSRPCAFGIVPTVGGGAATLGNTFLRAAYVVFDLDNNQISLAQTRFNVTEENIVEIARGAGRVPTSVFNVPTSSPTARGGDPTSSFTTDSNDGGGDPSKGLSTGAKAGIGVGAAAGAALIVGAALLLITRRRKAHAQPDTTKPPTAQTNGQLPEHLGRG